MISIGWIPHYREVITSVKLPDKIKKVSDFDINWRTGSRA
jgi:hypothetical protein